MSYAKIGIKLRYGRWKRCMVPEYTADAIEPYSIYEGDCVAVMKTWPDECIDAIVCDPPYDLLQASRKGSGRSNEPDNPYGRHGSRGRGFMGMAWDATGVAFDPATWKEALRVLKPGGHLLAMGGTRTFHRLACAIEDAGFEIRDSIGIAGWTLPPIMAWVQGQGFPKGMAIDKSIDKAAGAAREVVGLNAYAHKRTGAGKTGTFDNRGPGLGGIGSAEVSLPATPEAAKWAGWNVALKPAFEPIVVARKPLIGTVAENVLKYGTGGINIDRCRVATTDNLNGGAYSSGGRAALPGDTREGAAAGMFQEGGGRLPGQYLQPSGRWPTNLVLVHHPDCRQIGTKRVQGNRVDTRPDGDGGRADKTHWRFRPTEVTRRGYADEDGCEIVPEWECVEHCPIRIMGEQSGARHSSGGGGTRRSSGLGYTGAPPDGKRSEQYYDTGTAARFFPCFKYTPKASKCARNAGLAEGTRNVHATVKPLELMQWMVRLVTPPGGLVLDPFLGSGTTAMACELEHFRWVGIERETEYIAIAEQRIRWAAREAGRIACTEEATED